MKCAEASKDGRAVVAAERELTEVSEMVIAVGYGVVEMDRRRFVVPEDFGSAGRRGRRGRRL